ncbi:hypothetical protein [Marinitenerispora sediminis]|uniref:Uncharacterized protein n=1 Tax=Marinitenerispora sediminis TaxID=1931232 RepID=A0A368SXV3_9ACTN|nr:hypothetical protein [Marinitenerispora sediminis]RCV47389.1 hypothetical protein DEF23_26855 [Marinitenerispora sediminis]RCV47812.1 hypothetical protein DEF24_26785 [Marinitenerispora sediminis]RCV49393.1 hypothetical protein DEF28_20975 [Marinitenerispora sediminis]
MSQLLTSEPGRTDAEFLRIVEGLGRWGVSGATPATAKLRPTKDEPQPPEEQPESERPAEGEGTSEEPK